ncbi:MAG: FAD-dependent monooxygenase [Paenarthrobacter ureafaciens]|nr:FAD-dependent monooxygenase [Paenarthrobacter ureafaciens]MBN9129212.1 FAD-dependent monooxygenase [Paenarthrobacter ureafaciens]
MDDFDVAVVGAGPVGLTAALLLADGGARVVLLETAKAPMDQPRAISIADETFRTMDRLGLAEALKAESLLGTGSRYFGLNDRPLASSTPVPSRIGHPAKSQFDQPVLEELLWNKARDHQGIEFLAGAQVNSVNQKADGVTVGFDSDAGAGTVTASWLVAADGGRSFVRESLGIDLVGSTQQERWIVVDLLNVPGVREPFAEFHGNGTRPYVLVPGIKGRLRLEFMLFDHEDPDAMTMPEKILELSRPFHPELRTEDVRRAVVYVAHQRLARTYRSGRAFLIGDAAHLMPPFSGQGLNAGLRDALNLSWKLLEVLRGAGTDRLLSTYESERRTHAAKMVKVSRRTGAVVMAVGAFRTNLRDIAFRTVSLIPAIYRYLGSMRFITPPDYRNGVAIKADRDVDRRLAAWVGLALSQPTVADEDGSEAPLDSHLGSGWALITLGTGSTGSTGSTGMTAGNQFWSSLGARRITLTGNSHAARPHGEEQVLVDSERVLALSGLTTPHTVVVRPDRYVAAVFTGQSETAVINKLRSYVDPQSRA